MSRLELERHKTEGGAVGRQVTGKALSHHPTFLPFANDLAESFESLGDVLYNRNELTETEKLYRQALDIRAAGIAAGQSDKDARSDWAKSYDRLGTGLVYQALPLLRDPDGNGRTEELRKTKVM